MYGSDETGAVFLYSVPVKIDKHERNVVKR